MQRISVVTDVSEQRIGPIFKGQTVDPIGCSETLLSTRNCQFTLRNDPEERRFYLRRGGSLKSRKW